VEVVSKSVGFVVLPLSLVNVSIFVEEAAEKVGLVFFPVAFIEAAIGPHLDALAFAYEFSLPPLTNVAGPVLQAYHGSNFTSVQIQFFHCTLAPVDKGTVALKHSFDVCRVLVGELGRANTQVCRRRTFSS
jgi:hypothetical protein